MQRLMAARRSTDCCGHAAQEREKCALDEWMRRQATSSVLHLEDAAGLSARRKDEGCVLAEAGRFHEAIGRFQSAIDLTPTTAVLHELQAQCYMEAGSTYEAIQAAERAVECEPQWADGHQTLGRARLNLGERTRAGPCARAAAAGREADFVWSR